MKPTLDPVVAGARETIHAQLDDRGEEIDLRNRSIDIVLVQRRTGDRLEHDIDVQAVEGAEATGRVEAQVPAETFDGFGATGVYEAEWVVQGAPEDPTFLPRERPQQLRVRSSGASADPVEDDGTELTAFGDGTFGDEIYGYV